MTAMPKPKVIPELPGSPFDPKNICAGDELATDDRAFLDEQETIVEAGKATFLKVATALAKIRDYKDGVLYKRYGTFEDYCRERWEISRSFAHRLMAAAGTYQELLPRGNNRTEAVLPTTEKQLRELNRLKTPELRREAWKHVTEKLGKEPATSRLVAAAVRETMVRHGISSPPGRKGRHGPKFYKIAKAELTTIRRSLSELRKGAASLKGGQILEPLIASIEAALPPF